MLSELIAERQPSLCKEDAKQVVMAEIIRPPCRWKAGEEGSAEFVKSGMEGNEREHSFAYQFETITDILLL